MTKDIIIASGPWVGGDHTKPHRLVLVTRHHHTGGETYEATPFEMAEYFQDRDGNLYHGNYVVFHGEVWRAMLVVHLPRFFERVANYATTYAKHILLADWPEAQSRTQTGA